MLTRKGVYPYEYIDSWDKFDECKLPSIGCFYSTLTNSNISEEDYKFALELWEKFHLKNIGDLHDLYMNTDVMLLADVFESFRSTTIEKYKLDPAHFMTAPSLSWSACLKKTKVKLELLTDPDMSMFIDKSLLGGISAILSPYAKANNPQCPDYNSDLPLNSILYVDCNNLYGWAMSLYLPTGGFQWVETSVNENWGDFILQQKDEQEDGYFLEVDLDYPEELHDTHDYYPCAPEKLKISEEFLSEHQKELGKKCGAKFGSEKLCLTLKPKVKYILHL